MYTFRDTFEFYLRREAENMKKLLSIIICVTVLTSVLSLFPSAAAEFTMNDAEALIFMLEEHERIFYCGAVDEFLADEVPVDEGLKVMNYISPGHYSKENYPSDHLYYSFGEYKTPEYWKERLQKFLAPEYVEENFEEILKGGITLYDGGIYVRTGVVRQTYFCDVKIKDFKNKKLTVNGNEAVYTFLRSENEKMRSVEFKCADGIWRVSGGSATSAYLDLPDPDTAITKGGAVDLIKQMVCFKEGMNGGAIINDVSIFGLPKTPVRDETLQKQLCEMSVGKYDEDLSFYKLDGEYGKPSFWYDHLKKFLTDEYVEKNLELRGALIELDGEVYTPDPVVYAVAPDYPSLNGKTVEESVKAETKNTVLFKFADIVGENVKTMNFEVEFENTENGWRICGGEGAECFLGIVWAENADNPETGDDAAVITVCLLVSAAGLGITLGKRRSLNA